MEFRNSRTPAPTADLGTLTFTAGITTFTNGTRLAPGAFFVLARNPAAFAGKSGPAGQRRLYGQARQRGETLRLATLSGSTVLPLPTRTARRGPGRG